MNDLANYAPCGIFSYTDEGILVQINETFCTITGYELDELIGKRVEDLFPIATRIFYQTHFFPLLKMQGFAEEIFITIKTKLQNEVPLLLNARRIDNDGWKNVCSCIVVKNRRRYEDEIIEAKRAAEKALHENTELIQIKKELQENVEILDRRLVIIEQRNEELRQFGYIISHDLQEPLRKLSVFTDLLKEYIIPDTRAVTSLEKIKESYLKMKKMVLGLQQFVWLEQADNKLKNVDLNKVIASARQKVTQENNYQEYHFIAETLPEIQGDQEQLELMFYHLFENAINYRSNERELSIRVSGNIIQHNQFNNIKHKYKYIDYVKIIVADNGSGFDQQQSDYIFRLFKKMKAGTPGLGLGLAFCKKVADNHYGSIKANSKQGEGSVFTIMLPLVQE